LIDNLEEFRKAIEEIKTQQLIAVDCEGVCVSRFGKLSVLLVGLIGKKAFIFDILKNGITFFDEGLREILQNKSITKIMHDCRSDSDCFLYQFNTKLENVFDTQLASAVITHQFKTYYPLPISLHNLCKKYLKRTNKMKDIIADMIKKDREIWQQRPLTDIMLEYAGFDVILLQKVYPVLGSLFVSDKKIVFEYSQEYLDQWRSMENNERKEMIVIREKYEKGETKRTLPLYGFNPWDVYTLKNKPKYNLLDWA